MIFDTHAHYDDDAFDEDREELLGSMQENGVGKIVNIGASLNSCKQTIELMQKYDFVYGAIGVHPNEVEELSEESFAQLKEWCKSEKCVAVGEIGLDYYYDEPAPEVQKKWFVRQLDLAKELGRPVVIHSRDAAKDTIDIMKEQHAEEIGGVVHCFSYTKETAKIMLDMGFYIGIGGVLTFKNGVKLKEAAAFIPMDRIVLETDCPYLAPVPFRGKRNSSLYLPYVVSALAEIKGISEEEVRRITWENAHRMYRI
ncbi:MAG: TatD family deoxyribonuclease [Lachnospiraceae bacterium]|nr:TatD family deoxyribonuclease [Lachnospiraceae bacterium]